MDNKKYKLIVFDFDGTLVDSFTDIGLSVNHALSVLGFPELPLEEYKNLVGHGMRNLCLSALPDGAKDKADELVKIYNGYYLEHCLDHARAFDWVVPRLKRIKESGAATAVLSNKPDHQLKRMASHIFKGEYFDLVQGQLEGIPIKPAPDALNIIIDKFGVSKSDVLYVGDMEVDRALAENAGVDFEMVHNY